MPAEAASLPLTRLMAGLLCGASAMDPLAFAAVAMRSVVVTMAAYYIPASRAMRAVQSRRCGMNYSELCAPSQATKNIGSRRSYSRNPCVRNRCTMLKRSSAPILCFMRYK
jgi:hypothetical protein